MNVLTLTRSVVALEYRALRYPSQLLETTVVAARLPDDSGLRLAYERLLGAFDSKAGSLLADQHLTDRGRALSRRADVIEQAVALEAKAAKRKTKADEQLGTSTQQAQVQRTEARRTYEHDVAQAENDKQTAQAQAQRRATERKHAEREAVATKARVTLEAEKKQADKQEARIDEQTAARTAAPKAQLSGALEDTETAAKRKADADELAKLAQQEKLSRSNAHTG